LTGAVQGLTSFVKLGQDTLKQMTAKALGNANANGGNFSQTDLVTIQQRQTQVTTANDLAKKLQDANEQMIRRWGQ
jgi:hypothetical protein